MATHPDVLGRAVAAFAAFTVLAGCAGSPRSTGGGHEGANGAAGGANGAAGGTQGADAGPGAVSKKIGGCVETPSVIPASQSTVLGFSANDVLAAAGAAHQTDLAWLPSDLYASHSRARTETDLMLTFAATPTAVRFIDSQGGGCPGRGRPGYGVGQPCVVCSPRLEIDVALTIASGDGALNEQLVVTMKTMSREGPRFSADIPAADVSGSYFAGVAPNAGYQQHGVHVEAGYGVPFAGSRRSVPDQWNGFVAAQVVQNGSTRPIMQAHGYFPKQTAAGIK